MRWFLLNTEAIVEVDITGADALESCAPSSTDTVSCSRWPGRKQDLRDALAPSGLLGRIGEDRIFPTLPTAVEAYRCWLAAQSSGPDGTDGGTR